MEVGVLGAVICRVENERRGCAVSSQNKKFVGICNAGLKLLQNMVSFSNKMELGCFPPFGSKKEKKRAMIHIRYKQFGSDASVHARLLLCENVHTYVSL